MSLLWLIPLIALYLAFCALLAKGLSRRVRVPRERDLWLEDDAEMWRWPRGDNFDKGRDR